MIFNWARPTNYSPDNSLFCIKERSDCHLLVHAEVDLLFVGNVLNTKKMKIDNKTVHEVPLLIKTSCEAGRKSELKIERLLFEIAC